VGGERRRTLEDNTEGAFADFLAHPVVDVDDVLSRTGAAVGVCGHLEADGEGRERNINTRRYPRLPALNDSPTRFEYITVTASPLPRNDATAQCTHDDRQDHEPQRDLKSPLQPPHALSPLPPTIM